MSNQVVSNRVLMIVLTLGYAGMFVATLVHAKIVVYIFGALVIPAMLIFGWRILSRPLDD